MPAAGRTEQEERRRRETVRRQTDSLRGEIQDGGREDEGKQN